MTVDPEFHELRSDPDQSMTISPIRKSNWKTGGARDYWEPWLGGFRQEVVLEYTIRILADPTHPQSAAVIRIGDEGTMELAQLAGDHDLRFDQISTFGQGGSSIFLEYPNLLDIGGVNKRNMAIATSQDELEEFIEAITASPNTEESYRTAAEHLGMPSCCTDFHVENALNMRADPLYEIACNTSSAEMHEENRSNIILPTSDPLLNIAWRYQEWSFIQHLPCSFDCEESGDIARRNYDVIAECTSQDRAEYLLSWLKLPLTWSGYHGLVNLRNAYGIGSYTTDDYWDKKELIWGRPHEPKPEFEPNHPTSELEPLDPGASQV